MDVVGLSGGKDSTALALRLAEIEPRNYTYICNTTGNELPEMLDHWKRLEDLLGAEITPVRAHTDLEGLIADEEVRRGIYGEDMKIRFPMREWGWDEKAVWDYLASRGVAIPERTDCAWCPYQRLGEWRNLHEKYPVIYMKGAEIERAHGHTFRAPGRDTWPADLDSLAKEFDSGRKLREFKRAITCRVCSL